MITQDTGAEFPRRRESEDRIEDLIVILSHLSLISPSNRRGTQFRQYTAYLYFLLIGMYFLYYL
jgi:hypothetical protein